MCVCVHVCVHVCVCMCVCMHVCVCMHAYVTHTCMHTHTHTHMHVAKPVTVELRCHATALIFSFMDSFVFKQQVLLGLTFSL